MNFITANFGLAAASYYQNSMIVGVIHDIFQQLEFKISECLFMICIDILILLLLKK